MADAMKEEKLIQTLKEAADAHHEYEDGALKGQLDTQALGWYAGFVVGRLGDFATPSALTEWFHETRVRGKFDIAAKNVLAHLEANGADPAFIAPQKLSADKTVATQQLVEVLKAAGDAHHEFEDNALKGEVDTQALGWYAGFVNGRLGIATPTQLTEWFHETRVRGKFELAAQNVLNHLEAPAETATATPKAKAAPSI